MLAATPAWVSDGTAIAAFVVGVIAAAAAVMRVTRSVIARIVDGVEVVVQRETEPLHAAVHEVRHHVVEMAGIVGYELRPNGGGSVKDRVERIDAHLESTTDTGG